jgi:Polyketide cyclase / dehydrase and lipid transport
VHQEESPPTYRDAVVEIHVERTIAAPQQQVFEWLADPKSLTAAPAILRVRWAKGSPPLGLGAVREATCVGMWLREEYTAFDAPRRYSYRIVRAVPATDHDRGTLTFTPAGDGTHVDWDTAFTHPAWVGGKVLEAVTGAAIRSSFAAILDGCAKALEKP